MKSCKVPTGALLDNNMLLFQFDPSKCATVVNSNTGQTASAQIVCVYNSNPTMLVYSDTACSANNYIGSSSIPNNCNGNSLMGMCQSMQNFQSGSVLDMFMTSSCTGTPLGQAYFNITQRQCVGNATASAMLTTEGCDKTATPSLTISTWTASQKCEGAATMTNAMSGCQAISATASVQVAKCSAAMSSAVFQNITFLLMSIVALMLLMV